MGSSRSLATIFHDYEDDEEQQQAAVTFYNSPIVMG